MSFQLWKLTLPLLLGATAPAYASSLPEPVAIVESVQAAGIKLAAFDYLVEGQSIKLHPTDTIVLGYLKSCLREIISGGVIQIGAENSRVSGGEVFSEKLQCGGALHLSAAELSKSAVMVFRQKNNRELPSAAITLLSTTPLVTLPQPGSMKLERLDKAERIRLFKASRVRLDFASLGVSLAPGGLYKASFLGQELVFEIADDAERAVAPLLLRLLRLH
ncbi:hypothetical protein [Ferrovibrio sp.]|uniref:hypothetical protein n=1 Tax=Ferrovibrio sp. TaxID=1917215 RepID=UPI001B632243|nr:hypothetical protein [Ferrovibrio sp.]MBP7065212.1 hypothetical protein [Ferrovibrio sp.]